MMIIRTFLLLVFLPLGELAAPLKRARRPGRVPLALVLESMAGGLCVEEAVGAPPSPCARPEGAHGLHREPEAPGFALERVLHRCHQRRRGAAGPANGPLVLLGGIGDGVEGL